MVRNLSWCFLVAAVMVAVLLATPTMAGRLEIKNEISGVPNVPIKAKLAVRCWSNEDDLGWEMLKPKQSRILKFTTMNMWPFQKTKFRCQFRSGFGTTSQDTMTVFREECRGGGDECIWVAKRHGFYQRKIALEGDGREDEDYFDVLKSKWVWKW